MIRGAGFGHGVGMSAWGAYGYAKHGFGHGYILRHYFPGTRITTLTRARRVRVLIETAHGDVIFSRATSACGRALRPSLSYRAEREGRSIELLRSGSAVAHCRRRMRAQGDEPLRIRGVGTYRGVLELLPTGRRSLNIVNELDVNDYVRGSVPAEVYSSWPRQSLLAMAIAARSIGLTTDVGGDGFDLYSDTRTQLYRGVGVETARTNAVVRATRNQVVTYAGRIIQATYFSSSGGQTESGFLGAPEVPYLKSVDDPYDYYAPQHSWTVRFSQAAMDSKLAPYLKGSLRRIVVTQRGDSPRIDYAKLIGTAGTTRIRGDTLQAALGLYDRWAYFRRVRR